MIAQPSPETPADQAPPSRRVALITGAVVVALVVALVVAFALPATRPFMLGATEPVLRFLTTCVNALFGWFGGLFA